jgi:hypothetical protein
MREVKSYPPLLERMRQCNNAAESPYIENIEFWSHRVVVVACKLLKDASCLTHNKQS